LDLNGSDAELRRISTTEEISQQASAEFARPGYLLKALMWLDEKCLAKCLIITEKRKEFEEERAREYRKFINSIHDKAQESLLDDSEE
jgi:hypothetical protein